MPARSATVPEVGLGLGRLVRRLVAEDGFPDAAAARAAVAAYERFFLLVAERRDEALAPSELVDRVWQRHILDTEAYTADCLRLAGGYVHRGADGPADSFARTVGLLGVAGDPLWESPGPAHTGPGPAAEPDDDGDDFAGLLARVRHALAHLPTPAPWVAAARRQLDRDPAAVVAEYRRFLRLLAGCRGRLTASRLVDEFWHQHILDTRAYARFCARYAGRYLHHTTYIDRPQAFHERRLARTRAVYRAVLGCEPPAAVWAHAAESEGGGGDSGVPEPAPLYAVDCPEWVQVHLSAGRVNAEHYAKYHPVFRARGLPVAVWHEFLRAVDAVPQVTFDTIKRPMMATAALCLASICGCAVKLASAPPGGLLPPIGGALLFVALMLALSACLFVIAWRARPYDPASSQRVADIFGPRLAQYAVSVEWVKYTSGSGGYIRIDASLSPAELRRWRAVEERERKAAVADRLRRAAEVERERAARRERSRRQRRAARDAYYRERGIEPGPWAWLADWRSWAPFLFVGLGVVLPLALAAWVVSRLGR